MKDLNPESQSLASANKAKGSKQAAVVGGGAGAGPANDADADLEARLEALRRQ